MNWTPVFQLALICFAAIGIGICVAKWPVGTSVILTLALVLLLCSCTVATDRFVATSANAKRVHWKTRMAQLDIYEHDPAKNIDAVARGAAPFITRGLFP